MSTSGNTYNDVCQETKSDVRHRGCTVARAAGRCLCLLLEPCALEAPFGALFSSSQPTRTAKVLSGTSTSEYLCSGGGCEWLGGRS